MTDDSLDKGMQEAFGFAEPLPSVLARLERKARSKLGLHLLQQDREGAPIRVDEAVQELRDPNGRYQLLGEIGRGGVGTVYRGLDKDLGRDVAMKVLRDEFVDRPDVLARFVEEAQIGGQLQHPGIVPVYEMGLQAGERPYFAMKLVKGETLAAQLARRSDPGRDRRRLLGVFEQICQTIAYAHARYVVHRDLKPANVMIGAFGEVQVVDWGFAKVLQRGGIADEMQSRASHSERSVIETVRSAEGSGSTSQAGSMLGTPSYMPPEQAMGDIEKVDQRSDVFGLGAILCELLTGQPPYTDEQGDIVRQAATAHLQPALDRLNACGADAALVTLCKECLAPARRARPEDAGVVAARVHEHLVSVEERAQRAEVRAERARYRHRIGMLTAAAILLLTLGGGGAWLWWEHDVHERQLRASQNLTAALGATERARGEAEARGLDLGAWEAARTSAEQLRIVAGDPHADADDQERADRLIHRIAERVTSVRHAIAQRDAAEELRRRLQEIRIPTDDDVRELSWGRKERARLARAYAAVLHPILGEDPAAAPFATQLDALQRLGVRDELIGALDHWLLVLGIQRVVEEGEGQPRLMLRLRQLATALDDENPWRAELRSLIAEPRKDAELHRQAILALAERADIGALDATSCRVLSMALVGVGASDVAHGILRAATEHHPTDFGLRFWRGFTMELRQDPEWSEIERSYESAHTLRPEHREALHRRGIALSYLGRHKAAEGVFRRLVDDDPDNAHWLVHLAAALRDGGDPESAVPILERLVNRAEGVERAHPVNALGVTFFAMKQFGRAEGAFREASSLVPQAPDYLVNLGNSLMQHGDVDATLQCFDKAIALDSNHVMAWGNKAEAYVGSRQYDKALECLDKVLTLQDEARFHAYRARALRGLERFVEAEIAHVRAVQRDPGNFRFYLQWAETLGRQGKLEARRAVLEEGLSRSPDPASRAAAHNLLGRELQQSGNSDAALDQFRAAYELTPEAADVRTNLGDLLRTRGAWAEAETHLQAAVDADPAEPRFRSNLACLLLDRGDAAGALALTEEATRAASANGQVFSTHARALAATGAHEAARRAHERAIELARDNPEAHIQHGDFLVNRNQLDAAARAYETALQLGDRNGDALIGLGWIAKHRGDIDEAERRFRQALQADGRNWAALTNLGLVASLRQDFKAAIEFLEAACSLGPNSPTPYLRLLNARQALGDTEAMRRIARTVTARYAQSADVHAEVAAGCAGAKLLDLARTYVGRARELGAKSVDLWFAEALIQLSSGDTEAARSLLERALQQEPEDLRILGYLSHLHVQSRRWQPALELLLRADRVSPGNVSTKVTLCRVFQALGRDRDAVPYGRQAVQLAPNFPIAHMNCGSVHAHAWYHAEALRHFKRAAELSPTFRTKLVKEIARLEAMLARRDELSEVLSGGRPPADPREWQSTVRLFFNTDPEQIWQLTERVLRDHPKWADERETPALYNSACAVLLWAEGPGRDAAQCHRARTAAHGWLQRELDVLENSTRVAGAPRDTARKRLENWVRDRDLNSVRGAAIEALPEAEQAAWTGLWSRCRKLLDQLGT